ncbi:hypothetical protein [Chitinophaga rhizophila]|uniref:Copper chaperone CopZ n=1 Tax=Chitinophaga rhizophila TaxID=2866212 RepID=A0ABS7GA43_9BACT|nr:hypothetical protein [Chitinophaga rhizophila]MBW8684528.1 hypothetical protein [Chitinophaga rhizophila]
MVEVFKTNVNNRRNALLLLRQIHNTCAGYSANFDLQDCDRILRVECDTGAVDPSKVIRMLQDAGYSGEVLEDVIYSY